MKSLQEIRRDIVCKNVVVSKDFEDKFEDLQQFLETTFGNPIDIDPEKISNSSFEHDIIKQSLEIALGLREYPWCDDILTIFEKSENYGYHGSASDTIERGFFLDLNPRIPLHIYSIMSLSDELLELIGRFRKEYPDLIMKVNLVKTKFPIKFCE